MPPSTSNSSFIPKRGNTRSRKRKPVRQIFLFSILSYSLIFATLLAAGGSFLYKNYLTTQMQNEISSLNTEINTFSVSDLARVSEFDLALKRAADRFDNSASVATVLEAIDDAAIAPVQIESLEIERLGDSSLNIVASVITSSFDGALFQRKILADRLLFSDVLVNEVTVNTPEDNDAEQDIFVPAGQQTISFTATLGVPIEQIPYQINTTPVSATDINQPANQSSL